MKHQVGFLSDKRRLNVAITRPKRLLIIIGDFDTVKQDDFLKALNKIDEDVLCKMSEIKYDPNDKDYDRYFVNMNDGNGIYLTVNKFKKINNYDRILENIGKQNGVLYLDYGDFFEAK